MKKKLWIITIVITLLLLPITVSARKVKPEDLRVWNKVGRYNYVEFKITNMTKKTMIIDRWLGSYNYSDKKWIGVLSVCNKLKKQLASVSIAPGKSRVVRFTVPNRRYAAPFDYGSRAYINFKIGTKWHYFLVTPQNWGSFEDGRSGKYRVKVLDGKKKIPYQDYLVATHSQYKKIKVGMTYAQICKIFGFSGTRVHSDTHSVTYTWAGENEYSEAGVSFVNGKADYFWEQGL